MVDHRIDNFDCCGENLGNKDRKETYEIICYNCSQTFYSEDEETIVCPNCWEDIMKDFFESIKYERFDI